MLVVALPNEISGVLTEPVVHPEVREEVPDKHVLEAVGLAKLVENAASDEQTQVTEKNELSILGLVQRAERAEVVDAVEPAVLLPNTASLGLLFVVVVAGGVGDQVQGPAEELLANHVQSSVNRGLIGQFRNLVHQPSNAAGVNLQCLGQENHVTLHVASSFVVLSVGDLPGEVGNEQSGVADPANGVVQDF